jgi:pantothenate kinase
MDGYHYYRSQLEKMDNPQHALAKRGAPFTFDSERFVNDIVNLRKTGSGSFPSFDHGTGDPVENDILVEYKRHKIILVEGNYLFLPEQPWSRLLDETCFDEAWYVNCPVDEATKRVIDRHVRTGKTKETAELRAYSNDLVNAKLVDANKRFADVMIPNAKRFS